MTLILRAFHTIRAAFKGTSLDVLERDLRLPITRHGSSPVNISSHTEYSHLGGTKQEEVEQRDARRKKKEERLLNLA
jgi:hypothetical protein